MNIQHSIKTLDFFGPRINFTINRQENFKTVFGGFVSLIVYCLYVFFFILFGKDMIFKLNPNVTIETVVPDDQESFTIKNDTFFAWRFTTSDHSASDFYNLFYSHLSYRLEDKKNKSKEIEVTSFDSLECNQTKFKNNFKDTVYQAEDWNCFDFSAVANKNITGSMSSSLYGYVMFSLDICKVDFTQKTKYDCADYRKLTKDIVNKNLYIEFLFYDTIFRPKNYTDPLEQSISHFYNYLNLNLLKRDSFFLEKITVEQDDGILFSNEVEKSTTIDVSRIDKYGKFVINEFLAEYYANDYFYEQNSIYRAKLFYDDNYIKYTRKYLKIQEVFGNVKGFMEFLILNFSFMNFYINYRYNYFLFDKLVNVKVNKELFLNRKDFEMKIIKMDNRSNNNGNNGCNDKGESAIKDKFDVKDKSNIGDKSGNNNNYFRSDTINVDKNKSDFMNVSDNNQDSTKRQFNMKLEGILEEENNNKNANFPKEASVDGINVEISENPIQKNSLNEEDKKLFIDKLEKLSSESRNKRQYLKKSLCLYFFKSNDKKKSFDLKLQETYVNKINEKFDIFYYFRLIRQFKNLKKYIFKEDNESQIFKILASNAYDLSIKDYNDDFFKEEKNLKAIIEQWVKSINNVNQNSLSKYLFKNHQMLIQN